MEYEAIQDAAQEDRAPVTVTCAASVETLLAAVDAAPVQTFYHKLVYIRFTEVLLKRMQGMLLQLFPGGDGVLAYGFIDPEAGLSFSVVALAAAAGDTVEFLPFPAHEVLTMRREPLQDCRVLRAEDFPADATLFQEAIENVKKSYPSDDATESLRADTALNAVRNPEYPDEVLVVLLKDGCEPEGAWVRVVCADGDDYAGVLLTTPDGAFGAEKGDTVRFILYDAKSGERRAIADLDRA